MSDRAQFARLNGAEIYYEYDRHPHSSETFVLIHGFLSSTFSFRQLHPLLKASYNVLQGVFMVMTIMVVQGGVQKGIERASRYMMPSLFILFFVLVIRALTLDGAMEGVRSHQPLRL